MLIAEAVPAIVEINPPGCSTWPTNSGNVYVSEGSNVLALMIKFWLPDESNCVTRLTDRVAADAL
jgi:hypothetical protein